MKHKLRLKSVCILFCSNSSARKWVFRKQAKLCEQKHNSCSWRVPDYIGFLGKKNKAETSGHAFCVVIKPVFWVELMFFQLYSLMIEFCRGLFLRGLEVGGGVFRIRRLCEYKKVRFMKLSWMMASVRIGRTAKAKITPFGADWGEIDKLLCSVFLIITSGITVKNNCTTYHSYE